MNSVDRRRIFGSAQTLGHVLFKDQWRPLLCGFLIWSQLSCTYLYQRVNLNFSQALCDYILIKLCWIYKNIFTGLQNSRLFIRCSLHHFLLPWRQQSPDTNKSAVIPPNLVQIFELVTSNLITLINLADITARLKPFRQVYWFWRRHIPSPCGWVNKTSNWFHKGQWILNINHSKLVWDLFMRAVTFCKRIL